MQIFLLLIVHSGSVGWCLSFICIKWSHTVQKSRSLPLLFLSSRKFCTQFIPKSHCWSAFRCTHRSNVSFHTSLFVEEKLLFYLCFPPSPSQQTNCFAEFKTWISCHRFLLRIVFFFLFSASAVLLWKESEIARLWCLPTSSDLAGLSFYAAQHFLFGKPVEKCRPLTNVHVGLNWIGE